MSGLPPQLIWAPKYTWHDPSIPLRIEPEILLTSFSIAGTSSSTWQGNKVRAITCEGVFTYTPMVGQVWDGTLRRDPEITIHDAYNDSPNISSFTDEEEPQLGANVQLDMGDGIGVLAGGLVQATLMRYEGLKEQLVWDATIADHKWLLNKRRPFGCFYDVSATTIALSLIADYAPSDYSGAGVALDLPKISVEFNGQLNFTECFSKICSLINGKCRVDKNKVIHLFQFEAVSPPDPINDANIDLLRDIPITLHKDISQIRNRVFVRGAFAHLLVDESGQGIEYVGGQIGGRPGAVSAVPVNFELEGGSDTIPTVGDIVIITVVVGSVGRNPACAISGYTALGQLNVAGADYDTSMNVSWKRMGVVPDTSFTLPSSGNVADAQSYTVQVFRDVHATAPLDVTSIGLTGVGTARPDPAEVTPSSLGAVIVVCAGGASSVGESYISPVNFESDFLTGNVVDTTNAMIGSGYARWTSSSPVDPSQYGGGSNSLTDSWAAYTIVLRPAVSIAFSDVPVQLQVDGKDIFNPSGGQIIIGCQIANYTGVTESLIYPPPDASAFTPPTCGANADNTSAGVIKTRVRYSVAFIINGKESQRGNNNHEFTYGNPTGEILQASAAGMSSFSAFVRLPGEGFIPYGGSEYQLGAADSLGGIMTNGMAIGVGVDGSGIPGALRFEGIGTLGDPRLTQLIFWRRSLVSLPGDPQIGQYMHEAGRIANGATEWIDTKSDESLGNLIPPIGEVRVDANGKKTPPILVNSGENYTGSRSFIWGIASGPPGTTARKIYRQEAYNDNFVSADWTEPELCMTINNNIYIGGQLGVVGQVGEAIEDTKPTRVFSWQRTANRGPTLLGPPPQQPRRVFILQNVTGLTHPVREGDEVAIWMQVEDFPSQLAMATIEGGDGIHEYIILDDTLRSDAELLRRGNAELTLFKDPIWTVTYSTWDMKSISGASVQFNLTNPPIVADLLITDVTVDKIHVFGDNESSHRPRYSVTASSVKFTLDDLLRRALLRPF